MPTTDRHPGPDEHAAAPAAPAAAAEPFDSEINIRGIVLVGGRPGRR